MLSSSWGHTLGQLLRDWREAEEINQNEFGYGELSYGDRLVSLEQHRL